MRASSEHPDSPFNSFNSDRHLLISAAESAPAPKTRPTIVHILKEILTVNPPPQNLSPIRQLLIRPEITPALTLGNRTLPMPSKPLPRVVQMQDVQALQTKSGKSRR